MEKKDNLSLFYNPDKITTFIIGLILLIIILSQSFAVNNNLGALEIFRNILNHNSIYVLMLLYFVSLKTYIGKKYFNYLNSVVIFIYFVNVVTSLLTIFHAFDLGSLLSFALNFILFLYLFHVFFRGTRIWEDFKLKKSPFNELNNDWYFSVIVIISVMLLAVNLISTTTFDGTIVALLDCLYIVLFTRYIFLYRDYLDSEKIDIKNEGNLDEVKAKISDVVDDISDSLNDIASDVSDTFNKFVDDNHIDEKIDKAKEKIREVKDEVSKEVAKNKEKNVEDKKESKRRGRPKKEDK